MTGESPGEVRTAVTLGGDWGRCCCWGTGELCCTGVSGGRRLGDAGGAEKGVADFGRVWMRWNRGRGDGCPAAVPKGSGWDVIYCVA